MSNLLNQRFIILNETPEFELPTSHVKDENDKSLGLEDNNYVKIDNENSIDSTVSIDPEIDTNSTPYQDTVTTIVDQNATMTGLSNEPSSSLDEIEAEMEIKDDVVDVMITESVVDTIRFLNESVNELERDSIKLQVSQFNILTESTSEDEKIEKLSVLHESTSESLWSKFIKLITNAIEKIKNLINRISITFMGYFDSYGKWARKYEDELRKSPKNNDNVTVEVSYHEWNEHILFNDNDIKLAYNAASQIIGSASSTEDMEKKIAEYENRKWDTLSIYKNIATALTKASVKDAESTSDVLKVMVNAIRNHNTKNSITLNINTINKYIDDLKKIKTSVGRLAVSTRSKMVQNSELETLLKDAKAEQKKYSQDKESIRYKYYRLRYTVATVAQQVIFDVYRLKMTLLKEFAEEKKQILKSYLNMTTQEESIDYLNMSNSGIPELSYVMNEIV